MGQNEPGNVEWSIIIFSIMMLSNIKETNIKDLIVSIFKRLSQVTFLMTIITTICMNIN